ncbi:hypothetical protein [Streptomyces microflavus]|uniref:Uncharacterized protein n=1 Tax=Streptomyces microflavus TaxID=1919 RepID=A0A7H8N0Q6_STRMI|nr:hypothetical protein [Streptomyces microflavus]QKW47903.1 hypothetical protein HUT09_35900 [Streptomyces microflavus]
MSEMELVVIALATGVEMIAAARLVFRAARGVIRAACRRRVHRRGYGRDPRQDL